MPALLLLFKAKRLVAVSVVLAVLAGLVWLWSSRASALEELKATQDALRQAELRVAVEQNRRVEIERIVEQQADRRRRIDASQDACLAAPLPAELFE